MFIVLFIDRFSISFVKHYFNFSFFFERTRKKPLKKNGHRRRQLAGPKGRRVRHFDVYLLKIEHISTKKV